MGTPWTHSDVITLRVLSSGTVLGTLTWRESSGSASTRLRNRCCDASSHL